MFSDFPQVGIPSYEEFIRILCSLSIKIIKYLQKPACVIGFVVLLLFSVHGPSSSLYHQLLKGQNLTFVFYYFQ